MSDYMCGGCRKTREQLIKENKLNLVQGYEQCADCGGDLDHESVFKIEDIRKNAKAEAIKNDDYLVMEPSPTVKKRNPDAEAIKVPNASKYYPQWYKDHLDKSFKETNDMFRRMNDVSMYNDVRD